ncbi:MAG: S-layer homology domain-containing protein [Negativicutes bacterium]|nr:S-layer homology domain-containing protein [Negativicutes bacterium]
MKKTLFLVLMIVALLCFSGAAMAQSFSDMPNNWSTEALQQAVANGLLFGSDGLLKPNDSLKRAELAAIVVRAFGTKAAADISRFSDVDADAWYAVEMAKAVEMKVMEGDGVRLNPEDAVSREQAFAVLARAFHIANGSKADYAGFLDAAFVSSWFEAEMGGMVKAGYVCGSDNRLMPLSPISRAEFAQVMHNLVQTYVVTPATYTDDYAGNVLVRVSDARFEGVTFNGNLIAGDGIDTGNIYLKDCTVKGEVIIRGGGMNSVVIMGGNYPNGITIAATPSGGTRIFTTDAGGLEVAIAETAANETVKIEGSIAKVIVDAENANLEIADNTVVASLVVNSNNTTVTSSGSGAITDVQVNVPAQSSPADAVITLNANMTNVTVNTETNVTMTNATVTTLTVAPTAAATTVNVGADATVTTIKVNAEQTTVLAAEGAAITTVNVTADNVTVTAPGTAVSVVVAASVTGSEVNGTAVAANTTTTVTETGTATTTPTTPPVVTPPVEEETPAATITAFSVTMSDNSVVDATIAGNVINLDLSAVVPSYHFVSATVSTSYANTMAGEGLTIKKTTITNQGVVLTVGSLADLYKKYNFTGTVSGSGTSTTMTLHVIMPDVTGVSAELSITKDGLKTLMQGLLLPADYSTLVAYYKNTVSQ